MLSMHLLKPAMSAWIVQIPASCKYVGGDHRPACKCLQYEKDNPATRMLRLRLPGSQDPYHL